MKRETLRHPKTYDLASRLGCSRPEALGYLTLLWDFTADVAPQGDIGKWPDGAIAGACDWRGDASTFITALIDAGWLDRDEKHRLLVHDLSEHAERWWKLKLDKTGKSFIRCTTGDSTDASIEPTTEGTTEASPSRDRTEPNLTEPNPTQPLAENGQPAARGGGRGGDESTWGEDWEAARVLANKHSKRLKRATTLDRKRFVQVAYLAANEFDEDLLTDPLTAVEQRHPPPDNPFAFWWRVTMRTAEDLGFNLERRVGEIDVPQAVMDNIKRSKRRHEAS